MDRSYASARMKLGLAFPKYIPPIVFTLLPSAENQSLALDESSNCFPPLPIFRFCFCFFLIFVFFFSPFHIPGQYLPWRFAARSSSREELKQQRLPFNARLQPLRLWIHPGSILTLLVQKPIYLDPRGYEEADSSRWRGLKSERLGHITCG